MNTSGVENLLAQALKNLSAEWQQTRDHWRDRKALEFEKDYLEPLPHHVSKAANTIKQLNEVLRKVHNDCE